VVLRRENPGDRFGKRIGLVHEARSGDRDFDVRVFVDATDPALAAKLTAMTELRRAVLELLDAGFSEVGFFGSGAEVTAVWRSPVSALTRTSLETSTELLGAVALQVKALRPARTPDAIGTGSKILAALIMLGIFGFIVGSVYVDTVWQPLGYEYVWIGYKVGVPIALALSPLLALSARGRQGALRIFWARLCVTLCILPIVVTQSAVVLNATLDKGPFVTLATRVESCTCSRRFNSVRLDDGTDVSVSRYQCRQMGGHPRVLLVTSPGRFGWPWQVDFRLAPPAAGP